MRIAEICDWVAIEKLSELCPDGDMVYADASGFDGLGINVKDKLRKGWRAVIAPLKTVGKLHRQVQRKIWKKTAPERVQNYVSRLGKKGKGWFIKAAPFLAIAAEILNLLIPGLGVLVALAIEAAAMALQIFEARKAAKKMKKGEEQAEREVQAEIKISDDNANVSLMSAYDKGEKLFTDTYGMDRKSFEALPIEGKSKFFNIVLYDENSENMASVGVTREDFQKMSISDQQEALAHMAQYLPGAPGDYNPDREPEPGATTISPMSAGGRPPWLLIAGGAALVLGIAYVAMSRKS